MPVQTLVFRLHGLSNDAAAPWGARIRGLSVRDASDSIAVLIESSQEAGFPRLTPSGLVAALSSQTGRDVTAWMAWFAETPVGLVALAATGGPPGLQRHSIAWLLVSRHARRRGVGGALVATALRTAHDRGAAEVWVETRADWSAAAAFWNAVGFRPAR